MAGRFAYSLLVVSTVVCNQARLAAEPAEVPFKLFQQHLVVTKGSIGPLHDLNMLVDTGTTPSVVDRRIAKKLGLLAEPSRLIAFGQDVPIEAAAVEGMQIGRLQTGRVPALVSDLSYLQGVRVDAIVGLDVLARSSFSIDYRRRVITFSAVEDKPAAPMKIVWPFVTVQITIAGEPLRLLVDTGSAELVVFKSRLPAALARLPWRGDKSVLYLSGPARLVRMDLRNAGLGPDVWEKLEAWSLDRSLASYPAEIDGVLGVPALGCRRVAFDFERGAFGCSR
jgi:hypothetical protein